MTVFSSRRRSFLCRAFGLGGALIGASVTGEALQASGSLIRRALPGSSLGVQAAAKNTLHPSGREGVGGEQARIAEGWYAHNAMLVMLGAQKRIAATVAMPENFPWLFRLVPTLRQAAPLHAGALNPEMLLKLGTGLVFLPVSNAETAQLLRRAGMHVAVVGFNDFSGLLACVDTTATYLGTPLAARRAQAYRLAFLKASAVIAPDPKGPRVLHIASLAPLRVDGRDTIVAQWIRASGGRNAASQINGNHRPVTPEQVAVWEPDIVILGANAGTPDEMRRDPVLSRLKAVKNGRVYRNPAGLFLWDRYGPELLLQLFWARQVITKGQADLPEMVRKTRDFYRDFYGLSLSAQDAARMLAALPP